MKTWNHKDAVSRLAELLDRQGLGKVAEEVKTIKDPEEGQNGEGNYHKLYERGAARRYRQGYARREQRNVLFQNGERRRKGQFRG